MKKTEKIRRYVDYFIPREVMGPVLIVFSMENIIDILFSQYLPFNSELIGWTFVLILSIVIVGYWGETDEDMEEFEEELEKE